LSRTKGRREPNLIVGAESIKRGEEGNAWILGGLKVSGRDGSAFEEGFS